MIKIFGSIQNPNPCFYEPDFGYESSKVWVDITCKQTFRVGGWVSILSQSKPYLKTRRFSGRKTPAIRIWN